jgi:hypothetical protein
VGRVLRACCGSKTSRLPKPSMSGASSGVAVQESKPHPHLPYPRCTSTRVEAVSRWGSGGRQERPWRGQAGAAGPSAALQPPHTQWVTAHMGMVKRPGGEEQRVATPQAAR